jgi:hypothetical protein
VDHVGVAIVWTVTYYPNRGPFGGTLVTGELGPFKVEHFIEHEHPIDAVKLCLAKALTDLATDAELPGQQPRPRA